MDTSILHPDHSRANHHHTPSLNHTTGGWTDIANPTKLSISFQEGALEEAQLENERLKEKISGLKQQYGPIGKQGRVILTHLGAQLGRQIGGMLGYIIRAGDAMKTKRKPRGKIHDIIPLAIQNVKT